MAGGFLTGLGQGLQGASNALSDFKERQRQERAFAEQKRMNDSTLKLQDIQGQKGQLELTDLPRQQAMQRAMQKLQMMHSAAFADPGFQEDMKLAGFGNAVSPPQPLIDEERTTHANAEMTAGKADVFKNVTNFLNGKQGDPNFDPKLFTPANRTRMMFGMAGFGDIPKTSQEIADDTTARERASLPFDKQKIDYNTDAILKRGVTWVQTANGIMPVTRGQGVAMAGNGQTLQAPKTSTQKGQLADLDKVDAKLTHILDLGKRTKWKGVGSFGQGTLSQFGASMGLSTKEEQMLRAGISEYATMVSKRDFGTQFTESEQQQLRKYVPDINNADSVNQANIEEQLQTIRAMRDAIKAQIPGGDVQFNPGAVNNSSGQTNPLYQAYLATRRK